MPRLRPALLVLASLLVLPAAHAQWAWRDASGTTVFSDQPPPASIKPAQILRQPQASKAPLIPEDAPATKPVEAAKPAAPKTLAEREMDFQKRQKERAEAEAKSTEEEKKRSARAAECERARGYLRALESGQRISQADANGARSFLNDGQRAAEVERMRQSVQAACN